jgi:hypothetical protein
VSKTTKTSDVIISEEWTLREWPDQKDEGTLDDPEDDGRIDF